MGEVRVSIAAALPTSRHARMVTPIIIGKGKSRNQDCHRIGLPARKSFRYFVTGFRPAGAACTEYS
jgi:hypothetical protein